MKEFTVNKNDSGQRADKFIEKILPALPKSLMYKYIRTKRIKLNGKRLEISQKLCEGDVLSCYVNDEFFTEKDGSLPFLSAPASVDIIYEDGNIILAEKPVGLPVHDDDSGSTDTLIRRIQHYLYKNGGYDPKAENSFAPALCNRLDRNTGGIVIAAKNAEALRIMNEKIRSKEVTKKYLCICIGTPPKKEDTVTVYLFKNSKSNTVIVSDKKAPENRTAVTHYRVIRSDGRLSLLEIELITGRTHQIRVTMAHLGCPLLGDGKYGINKINREYGVKTQALYSYTVGFNFVTPSGILEYLNGRQFKAENVWFDRKFI